MEGIDGGDIGEDVLYHFHRERAFSCLLHQLLIEHLRKKAEEGDACKYQDIYSSFLHLRSSESHILLNRFWIVMVKFFTMKQLSKS